MTYTFPLRTSFPSASLRRDMHRLFDEAMNTRPSTVWQPTVNAREDASGYTLDVEIPGVAPESVEVLAEDGVLTVRGTRVARTLGDDERALFSEQRAGTFDRRFRLPKSADLQAVQATYALGVLSIRVSKVTPSQPRRVPITVQTPVADDVTAVSS